MLYFSDQTFCTPLAHAHGKFNFSVSSLNVSSIVSILGTRFCCEINACLQVSLDLHALALIPH